MATVTLPISANDFSISRKVHRNAIEEILRQTGLDVNTFPIVFEEDIQSVRRTESFDSPTEPRLTTEYRNAVFVTAVERFTEDKLLNTPMVVYRKTPLLLDELVGLSARSVFMNTEVALTLRFRFESQAAMNVWRRQLAYKEKKVVLAHRFSVNYDYSLPKELGLFVGHIHKLQENQAGYGRSLSDYVKSIIKVPYNYRSNTNNSYRSIVFAEEQKGTVGSVQGELVYNDQTKESGIFEVSFEYVFHYEQPTHVHCEIPIIVHNQLIASPFINEWLMPKNKKDPETNVSVDTTLALEPEYITQYLGDGGKRMLPFDDYYPKVIMPNTRTLLMFPVQVVQSDLHLVVNMDDLTEEYLDPRVKRFIVNNFDTTKRYLDGPYHLELIELNDIELRYDFTLESNGDIRTVNPMNLRMRYYLRISYIDDHSRIPNHVITKFLRFEESTKDALAALYPDVPTSNKYEEGKLHVTNSGDVTEYSYNKLILLINTTSKAMVNAPSRNMRTVQTSNVVAKRR